MIPENDLFSSTEEEHVSVLFVDTETTGTDTGTAEVCEIAVVCSTYAGFSRIPGECIKFSKIVKPQVDIPPEASAVHHITNRMVSDAPALAELSDRLSVIASQADYICAHNLPFDLTILKRHLPDIFNRFTAGMEIDTLRLARHIWSEIPSHALQVLRYRFDLDSDIEGDAHRALFDTELARSLLETALRDGLTGCSKWSELSDFIRSPLDVHTFSFGKYKGSLVEDIAAQDTDYVRWLLRQPWVPEEYPDLYHTLLRKTGKKGSVSE